VAVCLIVACAAFESDEIMSLPGWDMPLPSRMYSGYCSAGQSPGPPVGPMFMHYWFVESQGNPETDPVVMWYNGGPGASSLYGLLVELGPLMLNDDSLNENYFKTGIPQLIYNPYTWTAFASILVVDNPPPVGFSYCEPAGPSGNGYSCGNWNDTLVWEANHEFLRHWIKKFPRFANNDFYITGESYAGIYIPTIVQALLERPIQGINLKGFAVGDGCLGIDVLCGPNDGQWWNVEFMHGHGQFSNSLYQDILQTCTQQSLHFGPLTPECVDLLNQMNDEIAGYFAYALYDTCSANVFALQSPLSSYVAVNDTDGKGIWLKNMRTRYTNVPPRDVRMRHRRKPMRWLKGGQMLLGGAVNDYPCPGPAMDIWLNRTDVREALHVPVDSNFFDGDNGVGFNYTSTYPDVLPIYGNIIKNNLLRVLVYNGDTDPSINSFATQDKYFNYFKRNGIEQTAEWTAWTLDGEQNMGGYVTQYAGGVWDFLTVRGSGHMVPEFKPQAAQVFMSAFIANMPYPPYNPNATFFRP